MARQINHHALDPLLNAARHWIDTCLVGDGSLFAVERQLWTAANVEILFRDFVGQPDASCDGFFVKLERQLERSGPAAQQFAAELMWALFIFPSNVGAEHKREHIQAMWAWSGEAMPEGSPWLAPQVLRGVGSAGQAYNNYRWKEMAYVLALLRSLKAKPEADRRAIFANYALFTQWIDGVDRIGERQFRHMLRFYAFPDQVERMSSNADRRRILGAFKVATDSEMNGWTDRQFDEALLAIRRKEEAAQPGQILDFYETPLAERWKSESEEKDEGSLGAAANVHEPVPLAEGERADRAPVNLIAYGPPGTGKTHWLRQKMAGYTDKPQEADAASWLREVLSGHGWRAVIAAVLADLKRPIKVPELRDHPWIQAKAASRNRSGNVLATLWGYLQEHTPQASETVNASTRRPPFIFEKRASGEWLLLSDWQDQDEEARDLWHQLKGGTKSWSEEVRRYTMVTFHPSFTYEDFVQGIRPVRVEEDNRTEFQLVDGKFKQICDRARRDPGKRYAIFIDEINRANIAKVFGELITLIEQDKRVVYDARGHLIEGLAVALPGQAELDEQGDQRFGVPRNLDIFGTMNTADRSIALLDIALRRRFRFEAMQPRYDLPEMHREVEGVHLGKLLKQINLRLAYVLDLDHCIGHAYLMKVQSLTDLRQAFHQQLIPLLQEYFFDDFSRVDLVLSTSTGAPFVMQSALRFGQVFGKARADGVAPERSQFQLTAPESWTADTFRGVYSDLED